MNVNDQYVGSLRNGESPYKSWEVALKVKCILILVDEHGQLRDDIVVLEFLEACNSLLAHNWRLCLCSQVLAAFVHDVKLLWRAQKHPVLFEVLHPSDETHTRMLATHTTFDEQFEFALTHVAI